MSMYPSAPSVLIKKDNISGGEENSKPSSAEAKVAVASTGSSKSSSKSAIDKLKEQIKEIEKRLQQQQQQQQQLAAAQAESGDQDAKAQRRNGATAQRLMAIQGQIFCTSATLATQQAGLAQLEKSGSIDTTA
ncbi:MAG: hypothetical protein EOO88_17825 [Pedobacter sp.]|nr:MAG: hypothetical protein EOO88_17825 [Pedobacter sp.]